jgi:hypothetical protein
VTDERDPVRERDLPPRQEPEEAVDPDETISEPPAPDADAEAATEADAADSQAEAADEGGPAPV